MSKIAAVFLAISCLQMGFEIILSFLNWAYVKQPSNQERAMTGLGITAEDMKKSVAYFESRLHLSIIKECFDLTVLVLAVALGWFGVVEGWARSALGSYPDSIVGLFFFGILGIFSALVSLPFSLYGTFVIEEKFGFNKQNIKGFLVDLIKSSVIGVVIGGVLLYVLLSIMDRFSSQWWLYAWIAVTIFSLVISWAYPTFIAPLFNKFTELESGSLKEKIFELAKRVNFSASGLYVMDASTRSSHGNAYFTGVFGQKRIVLFDTLVKAMGEDEVVSVLAHELGHFKLNHVRMMLVRGIFATGVMFYLFGLAYDYDALYTAFGFSQKSSFAGLLLFGMWSGVIGFFTGPVSSYLSRRNEFAADRFAVDAVGGAENLCTALLKLRENSSSLPIAHPLYSAIHYSHPPILERIAVMRGQPR